MRGENACGVFLNDSVIMRLIIMNGFWLMGKFIGLTVLDRRGME